MNGCTITHLLEQVLQLLIEIVEMRFHVSIETSAKKHSLYPVDSI